MRNAVLGSYLSSLFAEERWFIPPDSETDSDAAENCVVEAAPPDAAASHGTQDDPVVAMKEEEPTETPPAPGTVAPVAATTADDAATLSATSGCDSNLFMSDDVPDADAPPAVGSSAGGDNSDAPRASGAHSGADAAATPAATTTTRHRRPRACHPVEARQIGTEDWTRFRSQAAAAEFTKTKPSSLSSIIRRKKNRTKSRSGYEFFQR